MLDKSIVKEEQVKNEISERFFKKFDRTKILGNIDFCISKKVSESNQANLFENIKIDIQSYLWAEAKRGKNKLLEHSFVQLILTIGRAKTFEKYLPPVFIGAFDEEKIAFIEYKDINEVFNLNDFNWNVTPSNHESKEFKLLYSKVETSLKRSMLIFYFHENENELKEFIKNNFILGHQGIQHIVITKNNFNIIYHKWLKYVKPSISVNWDLAKDAGIIDADFYLADLLSENNLSLKESLFVLLKENRYEFNRKKDSIGLTNVAHATFNDSQKAHIDFWSIYKRPPRKDYWDYIVKRRDLLVPQDVRERKGSFFTPAKWVELSQNYLEKNFGENWQDDYYIWDTCAGTGNLLNGLTQEYKIFASTIDQADVDVMFDRIKNGANLVKNNVFQFDFLNDSFDDPKVPKKLREIIFDEEKRKKLIIYMNPPYAEVSSKKESINGKGKKGVNLNKTHQKYRKELGTAGRELFTQFLIRCSMELQGCHIAQFSTLKILQGSAFNNFREHFNPKLNSLFIVPADTFDNVSGKFPIGFFIWNTNEKENFLEINSDVYDHDGNLIKNKKIKSRKKNEFINNWISNYKIKENDKCIGFMDGINANDFQHNNIVYITNNKQSIPNPRGIWIDSSNLIPVCVYFACRKTLNKNWENDRDQYLHPKKSWEDDFVFQSNCLIYTLFNLKIISGKGANHWIPFKEKEVGAPEEFESNFMYKYISGEISEFDPLYISEAAKEVLNAAKDIYKYFYFKNNNKANASFYDIKYFFNGINSSGKMNNSSQDSIFEEKHNVLKEKIENLAKQIRPKIYEHGFLE